MYSTDGAIVQGERIARVAYSPAEVAESTGLSETTVYALVRSGDLPHKRVGARIIVPAAGLDSWLSGRMEG